MGLLQPVNGKNSPLSAASSQEVTRDIIATRKSQYLRCPRSYRYRYLDGWREKDSRASLCFGRCFEKALAAFFPGEDQQCLFKEWGAYRDAQLEYSHGDDWERLLRQGIGLLEQLAQDNRIRIRQPKQNMQEKLFVHSPVATILWPMSMPSGTSTVHAACSNGRPPRLAIPSSPTD